MFRPSSRLAPWLLMCCGLPACLVLSSHCKLVPPPGPPLTCLALRSGQEGFSSGLQFLTVWPGCRVSPLHAVPLRNYIGRKEHGLWSGAPWHTDYLGDETLLPLLHIPPRHAADWSWEAPITINNSTERREKGAVLKIKQWWTQRTNKAKTNDYNVFWIRIL